MTYTVHLYRTDRDARGNKTTHYVGTVNVPSDVLDAVQRNYRVDSWLRANGYDDRHSLRERRQIDVTPAECRALQREHDRLKRAGLLPSAATRIAAKLAERG